MSPVIGRVEFLPLLDESFHRFSVVILHVLLGRFDRWMSALRSGACVPLLESDAMFPLVRVKGDGRSGV